MAITWLIEWRIRSSSSLSLVLGRCRGAVASAAPLPVVVATLPEEFEAAGRVAVTAAG
jgi:hypothetical protein